LAPIEAFGGGSHEIILDRRIRGGYANNFFLLDRGLMNEYGMLKRKYEWEYEVSDWRQDGDSQWVKTVDYSVDYLPKMYQFIVAAK